MDLGVRLIGWFACFWWVINFVALWADIAEATMEEGFGEFTLLACLEAGTLMPCAVVVWIYVGWFRNNNFINRAKLPYAQAIFIYIVAADDLLYYAVVFDYMLYGHNDSWFETKGDAVASMLFWLAIDAVIGIYWFYTVRLYVKMNQHRD